jgi:hypothetical protein
MLKLFNILLCVGLVGCATASPNVAEINQLSYRVTGKLHKDEYDRIIELVRANTNRQIDFYVTSYGGNSEHLIDAMDAVYQHGQVHWYAVDTCDSACAIMALATRHAHGEFKLHSFYSNHNHKVLAAPEYNERILARLKAYGYDTDRIHYMFDSVRVLWTVKIVDGEIIY